ncbi:deoxynucleoside triphosphate triphosphohydrolase SAMHD1-like [Rhincodon typus]|uniref:deoxynucleoside triphosphate triphosphohydrolase SAMHD1-like n=1 Tax=Rhincodon typus TaxID=259920 RepID=UPI0020300A27|nr:deoxynucleoside triphosphate triphosphohydrolase SAMHD1-like [Rhincodon typus]
MESHVCQVSKELTLLEAYEERTDVLKNLTHRYLPEVPILGCTGSEPYAPFLRLAEEKVWSPSLAHWGPEQTTEPLSQIQRASDSEIFQQIFWFLFAECSCSITMLVSSVPPRQQKSSAFLTEDSDQDFFGNVESALTGFLQCHGPFSHLFDRKFIRKARGNDFAWKHEEGSRAMFDHMIKTNKLEADFKNYGLVLPEDLDFIKEQIAGPEEPNNDLWPYKGRPKEKSFLYEIIANKRNGIDVDKWDYFVRDSHHLGIQNNFDFQRFLRFARVCEVDGTKQIGTRDKEAGDMYDMFHTRYTLHRRAFQHRVINNVESMITEALLLADPHIKITGKNGIKCTMSKAIDDMVAYTQLTDSVFENILNSSDPALSEAQEILRNLVKRKLFKFIREARFAENTENLEDERENLRQKLVKATRLNANDFIVNVVPMDYGKKGKDPFTNTLFYTKENPNDTIKIPKDQVSHLLPSRFAEKLVQVYCKNVAMDEDAMKKAKVQFEVWHQELRLEQNASGMTSPALRAPDAHVPTVTVTGIGSTFLRVNHRKSTSPDGVPGCALRSWADQLGGGIC